LLSAHGLRRLLAGAEHGGNADGAAGERRWRRWHGGQQIYRFQKPIEH